MIEYLDGPCGWTPAAPADLRRYAPGGTPTWRDYSTARILAGASPIVARTVRFTGLDIDYGMRIELLPEALSGGLRERGLRLASEEDMDETGFQGVLSEALDLIHGVPPLLGTVAGLCRSLHVLVGAGVDFDTSYSDPSLPFSIFVSCPAPAAPNRAERLAESIVHEALHLQLSLVEAAEALVLENREEEDRLFSPWKNELRTAHGILHGVYVFANLRCFWRRAASGAARRSAFAERRVEEVGRELASVARLPANPALTAMGRLLAKSLLRSPPHT